MSAFLANGFIFCHISVLTLCTYIASQFCGRLYLLSVSFSSRKPKSSVSLELIILASLSEIRGPVCSWADKFCAILERRLSLSGSPSISSKSDPPSALKVSSGCSCSTALRRVRQDCHNRHGHCRLKRVQTLGLRVSIASRTEHNRVLTFELFCI